MMAGDGVARSPRAQDQDQIGELNVVSTTRAAPYIPGMTLTRQPRTPSPTVSPIENFADVLEFLRGVVRNRVDDVDDVRIDAESDTDNGGPDSCGVFSDVDSDDIRAADEYARTKRDVQLLEKGGLWVVFASRETRRWIGW